MKDKEIINWLDSETGWDVIVNEIKDRCKIEDAKYIALRIVRDFGYSPTEYRVTDDLYTELSELCEGEDCKNGCQLMQEPDGTYYFQITGSNFYDKEDKYAGTDTVKIWFEEFTW